MIRHRRVYLSFLLLSFGPPAFAVEKASEQVLPFYGSFSYSIPIEVAPFRGLEPRLALAYSSEGRNGFVGVGWSLAGISVIERANPSRGTPNYNATDIFLLNGQELYPCQGGSVSPSCTSGGNYSTKVESYLKIRFNSGPNTWEVWTKGGIRTVFGAVYNTTSGTLRWGQTSTIDTLENTVTYQWQCSNGDCYPQQISYGSYRVTFFREARLDVISFATGPALGRMHDRLRSVVVWLNGVSPIRAYRLAYDTSPVTGQSLLTSVQQYGKDVIYDSAGVITGGSYLPAQVFTYRTDPAAESFVDLGPPPTFSTVTENVSWAFRINTSEDGTGNSLTKTNGVTGWNAGASSTRAILAGNGYVEATTVQYVDASDYKRWGLSRDDPSVDPNEIDFAFEEAPNNWFYIVENGVVVPNAQTYWPKVPGDKLRIEVSGGVVRYWQNTQFLYQSSQVPVYPLRVDASIKQILSTIENVVISGRLQDVSYWCWGNTLLNGDFNGDGRTDQGCYSLDVGTMRVKIATGAGFNEPVVWFSGLLNLPFTGDFNGDGKADIASFAGWDPVFSVSLSTGTAFGALNAWGTAEVTGYSCGLSQAITWTGDFNGDGVTDVACRMAADTDPNAPSDVLVGLSNGSSSFSFSDWTNMGCGAPADMRTGALDFNGDGKDDHLCISNNGHFYYYASTGSGFAPPGPTGLGPEFCGSSPDYVFGDFNGDGRTDAHCKLNGKIALSTGAGYVEQGSYGGWCSGAAASTDAFAADVDGDGASELVCNNVDFGLNDIQVRKWTDSTLGAPETWKASWCEGKVQPGDFNGDSKTDLYCDDLARPVAVAGTYAVKVDVMSSALNEIGGTISAAYTVASNFPNQTPTTKQVVASVTRNDGRGGMSTTTYAYSGALMDYKERRFLGFRYARENKPCISGEAVCPYTETWSLQDPKTGSKPEKVAERDGMGKFFRTHAFTYATNGSTIPHTSLLTEEWHYTYEGATAECPGPCAQAKRVRLTHAYDAYGNETQTVSYGDQDAPNDESTVSRLFFPATSAYIVGLVAQETQYAGEGTLGTQLRQTRYHYDYQGAWNAPPLDGYLTRTARWLDTTGAYVSRNRTYDLYGNLIQDKDETNLATTFTIDPTYHLFVASTYVIPAETTSYLWDPVCSQVSQETNVNNQIAAAQYDAFCRPSQTTGPLGSFQITTYPDYGNPALQNVLVETPSHPDDSPTPFRERRYFDGFGRTWKTARKADVAGGILSETAYTARGTVASQTAPYYYGDPTYTTTYAYDAIDRRTETLFPDDATTSATYGLWAATHTDPEGHEDVWHYDAYGRVVSKEPEGHPTGFAYDLLGQMVSMTDPMNNEWTWEYDSLGRKTEQNDPDSGTTTYAYDLAGRLTGSMDAKGQSTALTYSPGTGRLVTKINGTGTVQLTYGEARTGYFNAAELTTITDPASTAQFDYDALGRDAHVSRVLDGTTYHVYRQYDSGDRLRSITYPDGDSISGLVYDAANRVKTVPGIFSNAQYDAADRPTTRQNNNGTATTWGYNAERGWLDSIHTSGPATIQDLEYLRNAEGMVTDVSSPFANEGWTYSYDTWHRLTSATSHSSPTNNQTFQYNEANGITSNSLLGAYVYPSPGQPRPHAPTNVGGSSYYYDLNGNLYSGGGRSITWNANDLPTLITKGSASASFTYDGFGARLKKLSGSTTSRYPLGDEYEVTNGTVTKYIAVEGMGLVAKRQGSSTSWLHGDALGSIQVATNATGVAGTRRAYRPYGSTIGLGNGSTEPGWISERQDFETGLTYLHARYYDPAVGIFVSPDPIGQEGGANEYAYVSGDPINHSDPSGLTGDPTGFYMALQCGTWATPCSGVYTMTRGGRSQGDLGPLGFLLGIIDFIFGGGGGTQVVHGPRVPGLVYSDQVPPAGAPPPVPGPAPAPGGTPTPPPGGGPPSPGPGGPGPSTGTPVPPSTTTPEPQGAFSGAPTSVPNTGYSWQQAQAEGRRWDQWWNDPRTTGQDQINGETIEPNPAVDPTAFVAGLAAGSRYFGPAGPVFGRGRYRVGNVPWPNRGNFRIGWSWHNGRNWFGIHGGRPGTPGHWHFTPIPGPRGPGWWWN